MDSLIERDQINIEDEMRRPIADEMKLKSLKRQKLKLKEEMEALRSNLH